MAKDFNKHNTIQNEAEEKGYKRYKNINGSLFLYNLTSLTLVTDSSACHHTD